MIGELSDYGRIFFHSSGGTEEMIYFRVASLEFDQRTLSKSHVTCLIQIYHCETAHIQSSYFYKYFRICYISEETVVLKEVT
jgi:hypothetical protein